MTTRVEAEEIRQTASERVLAIVLGVFIFIGGIWGYVKLAEVNEPSRSSLRNPDVFLTDEQQMALARAASAQSALVQASSARRRAFRELTLSREAYRTALDAGAPAEELRLAYVEAQDQLADAQDRLAAAREEFAATRAAADEANRARAQAFADEERAHDRTVLALRVVLILGMAGAAIWLLGRLRARRSRYLPLVLAWLIAAALLGVGLVADYSWEEFTEISDLGPLMLAVAGAVMTLGAFVALQRYLARRLPIRRVARGECPFCGFARAGGRHCEGCGRQLVAECATCHESRRVGAPFCAACGNA